MAKVILQGHIEIPRTDLAAVQTALPVHIALTRQEEGCVVFRVEPDAQHAHIYHVYEEFSSQEAFSAHQARVQASDWGKVTQNVTRHYQITTEG